MLDRVHLVHIWDRLKVVSAVRSQEQSVVLTRNTKAAGVVKKSVAILCPAENTLALENVTKDYAELAKYVSMDDVTVASRKSLSSVVTRTTTERARGHTTTPMGRSSRRPGLASSLVLSCARGSLTVASTVVSSRAILRLVYLHTVLDHPMWSPTVLVAKQIWRKSRVDHGNRAKTEFPIAPRYAQNPCRVGMPANKSAIPENAILVWKQLPSTVVAAEQHSPQSVTKVPRNNLNAPVFVTQL